MSDNKSVLPWGVQDLKPGSLKTISESKLATFALGQVKKSRFQKAKEDAEEKKRLDQIEASKAYESFAASFDAGGEPNSKSFVRSADVGKELYKFSSSLPTAHDSQPVRSSKPLSEMEKMLMEMKVSSGL